MSAADPVILTNTTTTEVTESIPPPLRFQPYIANQPVDRNRRYKFVSWVVASCLFLSAATTMMAGAGLFTDNYRNLVELFENGLLGIATALSLSYVAGSVVDYNIGSFMNKPKG